MTLSVLGFRLAKRPVQIGLRLIAILATAHKSHLNCIILASVFFWPLLIIELVPRVVPARLIIHKMDQEMQDFFTALV